MPANDDLDPLLDAWLRQGVQPLAPAPDAFEKVSRQARRRKMGKLAIAASSAVALAAVAVFAVPAISWLRLSPAGDSASATAGRPGAPAPAAAPPRRTAGSATPAGTTMGAPTTVGPVVRNGGRSASSLPPSFQPASATFVSVSHGWVLGHSTTGGSSCGSGTCASIVQTTDNGHTWTRSGAPAVGLYGSGSGASGGVSSLRYLDGTNGWAFGPDLWSTHDGGQNWSRVATGGQVVIDVEASRGVAFAVFATCHAPATAPGAIIEYGQACTSFTLESASAATDNWAPVSAATTGLSPASATPARLTSPSIVFGGGTGWLLGPDGRVYSGPLAGGAWAQASAAPCPVLAASQAMSPSLLYWEDGSHLLYACGIPESGSGSRYPDFFVSTDGGRTWRPQAGGPTPGAISAVAYSPAAIIVASPAGLYIRPASTGQWEHVAGTPAGGFSWVGATSATQGIAVPATALNEIWMTYDGGLTWQSFAVGS